MKIGSKFFVAYMAENMSSKPTIVTVIKFLFLQFTLEQKKIYSIHTLNIVHRAEI